MHFEFCIFEVTSMDNRYFDNEYESDWDDQYYGTGNTEPPKEHNGPMALMLILIIFLFFTALVALEPDLPVKGLFFETVSAYSTVGASLNITPLLGDESKILVSILMFVGRIGLITILMSLVQHGGNPKYRFPQDDVIIN